jgi:hypothetical protein
MIFRALNADQMKRALHFGMAVGQYLRMSSQLVWLFSIDIALMLKPLVPEWEKYSFHPKTQDQQYSVLQSSSVTSILPQMHAPIELV